MITDTFIKFLEDDEAWDMFISGQAGTGKTTQLAEQVQYCIDNEVPYIVTAHTHKACDILRAKLPQGAKVQTLHSWLNKRPTINTSAKRLEEVEHSVKCGKSQRPRVVFIDEYSMVGEKDGADIAYEQDPNYDGKPDIKVVWLGDTNQLPPVNDAQYVNPHGDYNVKLTKVWRQDNNPLLDALCQLVDMIEGAPLAPIKENPRAIRGVDLVKTYKEVNDPRLLAWTNQRVQDLNAQIQGRCEPEVGDKLFCCADREVYTFLGYVEAPLSITTPYKGELVLGTKYKTLEYITESGNCAFGNFEDSEGEIVTLAFTFGHYTSKLKVEELKATAAKSNADIEAKFRGFKAAPWAKNNRKHPLARARAKAWRDYLSYDECVVCMDFNHATTVHKSQGSTYENVLVDMEDLYKCASINPEMYLKLVYVAWSRASNTVYTN